MKCIVVEDDPFWMDEISSIMAGHGVAVLRATTGAEALHFVRTETVTAMILDIIIPDQDGLEILRDARAINSDIRVLAISGGGQLGAEFCLTLARTFGANAIIEKPFTGEQLIAAWDALIA